MSDEFKPGDLVRLKSGGPKMTVAPASSGMVPSAAGPIRCFWFDERTGDFKEQWFSADMLEGTLPPMGQ